MPPFEFLGPYRIGKTLGRGGMGSVFSAVHEKTGERVAVKLIAQHIADDRDFRLRFDAEVKTLKRLRHRGIVRLVGFGEEQGQLFYSMELVDGEPLQSRMRREKKIPWQPTIDIAIQICSALKHAHDIGVIHRDLKPTNLLVASDDNVMLVDFGIAKIFGDGNQTLAGSILGTADYMAPEQVRSEGITVRTDLYSLGSVMYAMLSGRPPFTGKNISAVIASLIHDRPTPLELVNPGLPKTLTELIDELLEKDPRDRPPTALAVMNRLKAMREGLLREQTVGDAMPTESGTQASSSDTNATRLADKNLGAAATGDSQQEPTSGNRPGTIFSSAAQAHQAKVSTQDPTVVLGDEKTATPKDDRDQPPEGPPKTHFQTVEADGENRYSLNQELATDRHRWFHLLSLLAMVTILIGCGWWFVNATRSPSADQSYASITETGSLQAMDSFLRRFEEDPRYQEVHSLRVTTKVQQIRKRLTVQAKLGVTPLNSFEQGFLDALEEHRADPKRASEQLGLWLQIHDSSTRKMSDSEKEMIELAIQEKRILAKRAPEIIIDSRAKDLIARIRQSVSDSPAEESREMLEGILQANANKAWAVPAVEEAKRQLDALGGAVELRSSGILEPRTQSED